MILPTDFTFSQSNLQIFLTCPYRFFLRYVKHLEWPAQLTLDALGYERDRLAGIRFHQLIHQTLLGVDPSLVELLASNDPDPRIGVWFDAFKIHVHPQLTGLLLPEKTFLVTMEEAQLMGKIDLLQVDKERVVIYDWKTSGKPGNKIWMQNRLQTKILPLVYVDSSNNPQGFPIDKKIQMVYWEANQPSQMLCFNYSLDQYQEDKREIVALMRTVQSLQAEEFIKTNNQRSCQYCEYRSLCNRGVAAGTSLIDAEDFLAEDENNASLSEDYESNS